MYVSYLPLLVRLSQLFSLFFVTTSCILFVRLSLVSTFPYPFRGEPGSSLRRLREGFYNMDEQVDTQYSILTATHGGI
jgi:hypothetical protein